MSDLVPPGELVYNPYAFAVHDDPYAVYARLRGEAPAYWNPDLRFWALSRFGDVLEAFRDFGTFSSTGGVALESRRDRSRERPAFEQLIEMDPPEHTVFRQLLSRVFTVRRMSEMEDEVRRIVSGYVDAVVELGEADLVADITSPFPMDVISAVLGISEADRPFLRRVSDQVLVREDGSMQMPREALEGMFEMLEYFQDDLDRRRTTGDEGLISDLIALEVDGRALTEAELLGFCVLLVIAGHETTTKMVSNGIEILSRHPDQRDELVADPDLMPGAVEEVLRFHNSTQYMHRTLTRDHEMHGGQMSAGDSVLLLIGAANHDEREFGPTAEEFDIHRRPERHLAFGYGAHFCLGAALARLEGRVALEEIHRRLPDYEVDHDAKVRFHSSNVTGWAKLPIRFTPGNAA
ncbi:MAG: cytochrome P450 [Acidimicrobiales bacterium]|nr:cytochrome P450 [Acidimicrobiales bacterium]MDP6649260.1 cytochrome P450 [Acidimicrobiales bacterium]MDP6760771.1 cytochrome P450 [Acidimicrobiales bacterium]